MEPSHQNNNDDVEVISNESESDENNNDKHSYFVRLALTNWLQSAHPKTKIVCRFRRGGLNQRLALGKFIPLPDTLAQHDKKITT